MTGRGQSDKPLLGMIVDRSSFDEEDPEDELSMDETEVQIMKRRADGKVRRKLRWKPAAFSRSSKQKQQKENLSSSDLSVLTERSSAAKSQGSCHTFHSTATPVQSNGLKRKSIPMSRPNYRDTFDGVSTIDNEGQYVHAKNHEQTAVPLRSRTLPAQPSRKLDSPTSDAGYGTDIPSPTEHQKVPFDPFGDKKKPLRKRRPPRSKIVALRNSQRNNILGHDEAASQQQGGGRNSPANDPITPPSAKRLANASEEEMDASFVLEDDYEIMRRVSSFREEEQQPSGLIVVSPIKIPGNISPITTPTKTPSSAKRPPSVPGRTSVQDRVAIFEKMAKGPTQTTKATTFAAKTPTKSPKPIVGRQNDTNSPVPDMMLLSEARMSSLECGGVDGDRDKQTLGSSSPRKQLVSEDCENDHSSQTFSDYVEQSCQETVSGSVVVKIGSRIISSSPSPTPSEQESVQSARTSKARQGMGPVDVDDGAFVEAELRLKAIHEMASEHLSHGEYEEALEVFEEILRGQKERYGPIHYRTGTALHNIGIVHLKSGNYGKAVKVCREAVIVRKKALIPNHPDVAVSLAQLGVAHLETKNYREALVAFREALQIRRDFLGPKHPKVAKILNNVGCALYELDELDGAHVAFEEALEIQHLSLRNVPIDESDGKNQANQILLSIAATLCNIGSIKARWSEIEEAHLVLEEALLIQQSVLGDTHPTVCSTVENIDQLDRSTSKTADTSVTDFLSFLMSGTGASNKSVSSLITDEPKENDDVSVENLISMVTAFTMNRSKRLYKKVEGLLPRDQVVACGYVATKACTHGSGDDTGSLSDSASIPFSEGSSTISYRKSKMNGYEI